MTLPEPGWFQRTSRKISLKHVSGLLVLLGTANLVDGLSTSLHHAGPVVRFSLGFTAYLFVAFGYAFLVYREPTKWAHSRHGRWWLDRIQGVLVILAALSIPIFLSGFYAHIDICPESDRESGLAKAEIAAGFGFVALGIVGYFLSEFHGKNASGVQRSFNDAMEDLRVLRLRATSLGEDIAALKEWAQKDASRAQSFSRLLETADETVADLTCQVESAEKSIVAASKQEPPSKPDPDIGGDGASSAP